MIETMYKTKIVGIKTDIFDFIGILRNLKTFHVDEVSTGKEDFMIDSSLKNARVRLEGFETRISSIFSHLPLNNDEKGQEWIKVRKNHVIIEEAEKILDSIEPRVQKLESSIKGLELKIVQLKRYEPILNRVKPLEQKIDKTSPLESRIVILDRRSEITLQSFEKEIAERTHGIYELFNKSVDENYDAVLLLIDKIYLKDVNSYLTGEKISEFSFPRELRNIELKDMNSTIKTLISKFQNELTELEHEKEEISQSNEFNKLRTLQKEITARLTEFQLAEKMSGTKDTFEIEGFIPKSKWSEFESKITEKFGKRILVTKFIAKKDAPVLRSNPKIIKPFEVITNMIQLPEYGSIDPTPLIFLFFPFFWGFMVGDVGYAGVILLISLVLRFRFKKNQQTALKNITEIFIISSLWAMFFGILYFEIFGNLGERIVHDLHLNLPVPLLDRYNEVEELLILAVIIGYGIIIGGMVLSIYNNLKLNHMSHVYSNILLIFIWGSIPILLIVGVTFPDMITILLSVDLILILIAIGFLLKFEGIAGIIHVIEKFSNILSFARLMAIGLVGAWMGFIANDLIHPEHGSSLGIFGILLGLGLHLINIAILILSPSIHAMRLNVYEFFSQFVLGGGNTYQPFGTN